MKKYKLHLPFLGAGVLYGLTIIGLTVAAYFINKKGLLNAGIYTYTKMPFAVIAIVLIVFVICLWIKAVIFSKITAEIKQR